MNRQLTLPLPPSGRAAATLLVITAAVILTGSFVLNLVAGESPAPPIARLAALFSADGEANLWAWYSGLALGGVGSGFAALASCTPDRAPRRAYWVFAIIGFCMSADEVVQFHEMLLEPATQLNLSRFGWLGVGAPIALVGVVIALALARSIDRNVRRRLTVAGVTYLAGAVGLESTVNRLLGPWGQHFWSPIYLLEVTLEEGLEFAGSVLVLRAIALAISSRIEAFQ